MTPQFAGELMQLKTKDELEAAGGGDFQSRDELYEAAVDIVVRERRGSVSLLQRALGIGYGRAARLIDFMAEDGIVGQYNGSQARDVLISTRRLGNPQSRQCRRRPPADEHEPESADSRATPSHAYGSGHHNRHAPPRAATRSRRTRKSPSDLEDEYDEEEDDDEELDDDEEWEDEEDEEATTTEEEDENWTTRKKNLRTKKKSTREGGRRRRRRGRGGRRLRRRRGMGRR